jgi:Uma2 family endonuclease
MEKPTMTADFSGDAPPGHADENPPASARAGVLTPLPDFGRWPPVGRVTIRDGLVFVHAAGPGGFTVEDYRRIPGKGRIELWDGVAVVHPRPDRRSAILARYFYALFERTRPDGCHPCLGPVDVQVGRRTVYAPDVLVLPSEGGTPAVVVEFRRDAGGWAGGRGGADPWRRRLRGYFRAGVGAYWVVDPDRLTLTVHERGGSLAGSDVAGRIRAAGRRAGRRLVGDGVRPDPGARAAGCGLPGAVRAPVASADAGVLR